MTAMGEEFEIFDESGKRIGTAPRSEVHRNGHWHRASNVFLFYPDGRLLIQRRQTTKDVWPGAWDVSAAEHLLPGETFEQGAHRGLREELGVVGTTLELFGAVTKSKLEVPESGILDFEFQQSFLTVYGGQVSPDPAEVMETRVVDLEDLEAEFARYPETFTPWFRQRARDLDLFSSRNVSARQS
jgi:isopentenyl-diphosphate delta-isomerase